MAISYRPLWIQLANKGLQKKDVIKRANLTTNVMASMGKNQTISFKNLEKICNALDCSPNDVFEFVNEESER
ncbi:MULTISPECIES: helix-turn-helix transcriptional regulator [Ruminococcus]|jgi:putative transcriptional regulator|uniref:XRE family transcriptional regulator n=1 Tax=Ruminococcus bromii TaxID=40518 RepID=A0ABT0NE96_9FIRM|nr:MULTISPECIES: helix-turn-helix transcriptional regulator [Ruminococcus]MBD9050942.1 XRE family transcriptional regulator [Ruminococcus sp.]MBD9051743.1 XRE family transcriptional regulator [Ruminococcus sp.]MCL3786580.1 XRE family transcriptional regulator [Ruminococcus bromii]